MSELYQPPVPDMSEDTGLLFDETVGHDRPVLLSRLRRPLVAVVAASTLALAGCSVNEDGIIEGSGGVVDESQVYKPGDAAKAEQHRLDRGVAELEKQDQTYQANLAKYKEVGKLVYGSGGVLLTVMNDLQDAGGEFTRGTGTHWEWSANATANPLHGAAVSVEYSLGYLTAWKQARVGNQLIVIQSSVSVPNYQTSKLVTCPEEAYDVVTTNASRTKVEQVQQTVTPVKKHRGGDEYLARGSQKRGAIVVNYEADTTTFADFNVEGAPFVDDQVALMLKSMEANWDKIDGKAV